MFEKCDSGHTEFMTVGTDQELGEASAVAGFARRLNVALDSVVGSPTWSMSTAEHAETLLALTQAQDRLESLRLRVLASAETIGLGSDEALPMPESGSPRRPG